MDNQKRLADKNQQKEGFFVSLAVRFCSWFNGKLLNLVDRCVFLEKHREERIRKLVENAIKAEQAEEALNKARMLEQAGHEMGKRAIVAYEEQAREIERLLQGLRGREAVLIEVSKYVQEGNSKALVYALKREGYLQDSLENGQQIEKN